MGDYVKVDIKRSGEDTDSEGYTDSRSFYVSTNGLLEVKNAIVKGTVYAGKGEVGGWTITDSCLRNNTTDSFGEYTI
jgi:hypothetical protein